MEPFVLIDKPQGMTPLSAIEFFRRHNPEYDNVVLGVAGRLDPMADGLLLVLVGDENKKRHDYEKLQKTYFMELLFGFETDTYDELGLIQKVSDPIKLTKRDVEIAVAGIPRSFDQQFPPFSSKPVNGKPLYYWAREGTLETLTIPKKKVAIYHRSMDSWHTISRKTLHTHVRSRVSRVTGDFRQEEILQRWESYLSSSTMQTFPVATIQITCSSGTYMRGLAHMIGETIGVPALAYSIKRTHIGQYTLNDAVKLV